jgi:glycosyltransferase involved in cell wall biosynthesis
MSLVNNSVPTPERIPSTPPIISPVTSQSQRPLWSVMIPVYNCLCYLQEALESVLSQAPGKEHMQIAVIDDCSTDGDVLALVQRIGKDRVEYFRQEKNVGSLRNFETCLNRSIGHWVHILHGDDLVIDGFYLEIQMLFQKYPEAGAAFTRAIIKHSKNEETVDIGKPILEEAGIIKDFLLKIAERNQLETPCIVVKRSVYEQLGGFFAVHYGEDWEMWTRIAAKFPIAYSPKCLSCYRYLSGASITHQSIATAQNVRDIARVIDIIQQYLPIKQRKTLRKMARYHYSLYCASMAHSLYDEYPHSNNEAALAQIKGALKLSNNIEVFYLALKLLLKVVLHYNEFKEVWKEKVRTEAAT